MKRFIALVLSLVMALSLCAPAWAAEDSSVTEVSNLEDLQAAATVGGNIKLMDDITNATYTVFNGAETVLDLNGHTIKGIKGDDYSLFDVYTTMTITGGGLIEADEVTVYVYGGDLLLDAATIKATAEATQALIVQDGVATINGGAVSYTGSDEGGSAVYAFDDASVDITAGNFTGYVYCLGTTTITGGTFSVEPDASYVADGYIANNNGDGTWTVAEDISAKLKADLAAGKDISLEGNTTVTASAGGYNLAGLMVNGQTINGNDHTLTIVGANDTWDCGIYTSGGTIKNMTIGGSFRGIFTAGTSSDIIIDNVVIDNVCYPFNSDGGNKNYGVYISNSTLNGWTSFGDVHKEVVFTNCVFGAGTGAYTYAFCRPYNTTQFVNCKFDAGFVIEPLAAISFENCTLDGVLITDDNVETLVPSGVENVTIVKHEVSFEANGGKGEMTPVFVVANSEYELPACGFTIHEGKEFKAWSVDGKEYAVGAKVAISADTVVTAVWEDVVVEDEVSTDAGAAETADPTVDVMVDTTNKNATEKAVVDTFKGGDAVTFDDTAIQTQAAAVAEDNEVTQLEGAVALESVAPVDKIEDVAIVVQPYYDVEVKDVEVVIDVETNKVASASIELNITPMYQTIATTKDVVADPNTEIEVGTNAAVVGEAKELKVTEPVTIKVAIPSALAIADGDGFKPLFVTHEKDNGTKYVYVAKVETDGNGGYTATFVNPNGFSTFTLSTENNTVAVVGDMNYATLQGAIDNAGKGAVIEVMVSGLEADITAPFSFKLKLAEGVDEPTFNVAKGYTMSKWYVNGVYTYIVQSASAGGYAPSTTPEKVVTSAKTFDAGIALYVGMSVMAAAGSAVVLKKRED